MPINYPIKKTNFKKTISMANRGMSLEEAINQSNIFYLENDLAIIYKKPIPIQVVDVSYPIRSKAVITKAFYKIPSTTDYNGIYLGKYIDFEAKETSSKTSFPLKNIHEHQIIHLNNIQNHGGIGFIILYFKYYDEYYLIPFNLIKQYWDIKELNRKSIPYQDIKEKAFLIKEGYPLRLDYLKVIKENL